MSVCPQAGGQSENAVVLRKLQAGHSVTCTGEDDDVLIEHWTKPPPRYNEVPPARPPLPPHGVSVRPQ